MPATLQAFKWNGINKQGKRVSGTIQVHDSKEVQGELKKQDIVLVSFTQKRVLNLSLGQPKVKSKHILLFTRYLSTMITAGLPLLQALDVIAQDKENALMQSFVLALRSNISGGKTLGETFSQFPNYFSSLYCSLIKAGEKSGTLDQILKRLANYLERTESLKGKVKKALTYPIAIITIALLVSSILLIFVVPKFQDMFKSFGAQLPMFTRMVIGLSNFMQSYWWLILIAIVGSVWTVRYYLRVSDQFHYKVDSWCLRLWIIGPLLKRAIISRFTRTLATTLEAGMPITEAMRSMTNVMDNRVYAEAITKITSDIENGQQLNVSLSNTNLFPNMVIQMISVGEVSGRLSEMLTKVAEYYEEEVNNTVDNLSSLLEPLIMLILGVIIGGLVIAMYLPIFKLGSLF